MNTTTNTKAVRKSALAIALGMCFAAGVHAQSNSTGSIAGTTDAGATVTIENKATGFKREINADASGGYRIGSLPTGTYQVTTRGQTREVGVSIGATATGSTTDLDAVNVKGGVINAIDISSVESTTILTAEQIAKIPVARNITGVALLAPGTVRGDAAFGNLASFGGSSVAENQFFVNGFNITNSFKNINFGQVPFEAIAEQQVKTGGYGAEFGRATGGVINLVTRRGSNEFHAGGNIFLTPGSLSGRDPNVYSNGGFNVYSGNSDSVGLLTNSTADEPGNQTSVSAWASGALVQDRLFAYALLQYGRNTGAEDFDLVATSYNQSISSKSPTWLVKLDWNINDDHLLELTAFSDTTKTETEVFSTIPGTNRIGRGAYRGTVFDETGGNSYTLKYTGYLSDNFTLSALVGNGKSKRSNYGVSALGVRSAYDGNVGQPVAGCPVIVDIRIGVSTGAVAPITGCDFIGSLGSTKARDERTQYRVDAEWTLGDHLLRFGYDVDQFTSVDARTAEGGVTWRYSGNPNVPATLRVRRQITQTGAEVDVDSKAFYVEDKWQVTDNFLAYLGLRWDSFSNKNGVGQEYVSIDNQLGPRLGFSWDVNGDGKFKVFGNAGRYALPLTANVAIRGASASLFTRQSGTYTGIDPLTGAPIGFVPGTLRVVNNEFGVGKDPRSIASDNLEPMYQDEYIFGFQTQLTDNISGGVRAIYRNLKRAIDDTCDYRPILAWAGANGYDVSDPFSLPPATPDGAVHVYNPGFAFCHLYNPGSDGVFNVDVDGDGKLEKVTIAADVLGPKAKRTYKAVEFFAEAHWDKFFLQGSYTWAQSFGNTEGGVKSDIGQADTGTTQDFDYPELAIGSEGFLPNDRRHSLKLFGNYQINDEWSVGANLIVQSGRPINCFGVLGNDPGYQNSYFSCGQAGADVPNASGSGDTYDNGSTIIRRGTAGRTPWTRTLDLNVAWKPAFAEGKLTFKADVFNVFNEHGTTSVSEAGENSLGQPLTSTSYKTPTSFQAPRSFRFMVQYDY